MSSKANHRKTGMRGWSVRILLLLALYPAHGRGQVAGATRWHGSLPDPESFLARTRANLRSDRTLLSHYTFTVEETESRMNRKGEVTGTEVRAYEVYPGTEEALTYRRLVSKNGVPLDAREIEQQDRRQTRKMRKAERDRQGRDPDQKPGREREEQETIAEMFELYRFTLLRREWIDGHPTILVRFVPDPDYEPATKDGKMLKKLRGLAWVSERDHELVRIEATLIEPISIGLGMIARLHKGARMFFQRRKVNDEIWLPEYARFVGSARILLLRRLGIDHVSRFSDYKKFTVASKILYPEQEKESDDAHHPQPSRHPSSIIHDP